MTPQSFKGGDRNKSDPKTVTPQPFKGGDRNKSGPKWGISSGRGYVHVVKFIVGIMSRL